MATLADVIKKRRSMSQSRTRSLAGSLKEKFLEKIDPRQFLNQSGVLTALFPSLKAFKSTGINETKLTPISVIKQIEENPSLDRTIKNTKIAAINFGLLPNISRDVNVMKQNLIKVVKYATGNAATKADAFFLKRKEYEKLYESKYSDYEKKEKNSKVEKVEKQKKKGFSWMNFLTVVGTGAASALVIDFLINKEQSVAYKLYEKIKEQVIGFKDEIKEYVSSLYQSIEKNISSSIDFIQVSMENLMEELKDFSTERALKDFFDLDKSLFDQFEEKIEESQKKIVEGIKQFSILPTAQASTLTSLPSPMRERLGGKKPEETTFAPSKIGEGFIQASSTQELLEFIAKSEGTSDEKAKKQGFSSGYDVPYGYGKYVRPEKPLSQMTLSEVKEFQQKQIQATRGTIPGSASNLGTGAVGKYQITLSTLQDLQRKLGLKETDIFSPQLQDRMAIELMRGRGLEKFLNKKMTTQEFQNQLAREWASIPTAGGGGVYGQPLGASQTEVQSVLNRSLMVGGVSNKRNVQQPLTDLSKETADGEFRISSVNNVSVVLNNNLVNINRSVRKKEADIVPEGIIYIS